MLNKYKGKSNGTQPVVVQIIKESKEILFLGQYVKPEHETIMPAFLPQSTQTLPG